MKKRNDDLRLECVNWDEEQPATIKSKGRNHAVSRKVGNGLPLRGRGLSQTSQAGQTANLP